MAIDISALSESKNVEGRSIRDETWQDPKTALTGEGVAVGTVAYMSPEQLRGEPIDQRSDIFSLGIVLFELLTGVHPFRRTKDVETCSSILNESPGLVSKYREHTPELLLHTVRKMLAKNPKDRYQSIHEVHTDLTEQLRIL